MKTLPLLTVVLPSVALALPARADATAQASGRGQQSIGVKVSDAGVVARVCASGACAADGGTSLAVGDDVKTILGRATATALDVGDGKKVVRIEAKGAGEEAWTMVVAAPVAGKDATPVVLFSGWTKRAKGEEGESRSSVVIDEVDDKTHAHRLVFGEHRDDVTICGRPAIVAAKEIDTATMALRTTAVQSLSLEDRNKAEKVTATRVDSALPAPPARLLKALAASSAVEKKIATATDGDIETAWSERTPGEGGGEFLSMSASSDVPITSLELTIRPANGVIEDGAAPKSFFVATRDRLVKVTMPEDAWKSPGKSFEVKLAAPIAAECVAIVLDQAYAPPGVKNPKVSIAEVVAHSKFDGMQLDALVGALAGGDERANGAAAILARSGGAGIPLVARGYGKLDDAGKRLALGVVDAGTCAEQVPFFMARLTEATAAPKPKKRPLDAPPGDDEADPLLAHAIDRLRRCPSDSAVAFARAVGEGNERLQAVAAAELAMLKPASAVPALVDALPKASDATRQELRAALAHAAKSDRALGALRSEVDPAKFAARPEVARIDLLRAVGPVLPKVEGASAAFATLATPEASFRTKYLLQAPAAELARGGDAKAEAFLRDSLRKDGDAHVRAKAAEAAASVGALAKDLVGAVDDSDVRVRQAAIEALAKGTNTAAAAVPGASAAIAKRLSTDEWTFVRSASARALAAFPASPEADKALSDALADKAVEVRSTSLDALGAHRAAAYASAIHARVDDTEENLEVRAHAVLALGGICDQGSLGDLTKLAGRAKAPADDLDRRLGASAIAALGMLHPADLDKRLAPLLDKDTPIAAREGARAAIAEKGKCGAK